MFQKILIAGASGRTGKIIVEKLLQTGLNPHVLVRDPVSAHKLWQDQVIYHQGDVREFETLLPAARAVTAVISAIGAQSPVGKNCPKRVEYQGVTNLVNASRQQNVTRFVLISSIAVTRPEHPMNRFGRILDWKLKGEHALRESGLEYAIIRPGGLKDTPGGQRQLVFSQGDHILGMLSRADLAEICLQALQYPHRLNITFEVIESDQEKRSQPQTALFASLATD